MAILITAPNLDERENVSGISAVVNTIIQNSGFKYIHYRLGRSDKDNSFTRIARLFLSLLKFPFFLIGKKIDLLHLNWALEKPSIYRDVFIFTWCKILRYKVVVHLHGGKYLMQKSDRITGFIIRFVLKNADILIVLSSTEAARIKALYGVKNCEVLANSVMVDPEAIHRNNKIPVFLYLGRICESKGVEDIVKAFRIINKKCKCRFVLCGTGPMTEYMVTEMSSILGDRFTYKGVVKGTEKMQVLNSSDYFLLPSRYGEGLPMALLETMAKGIVPIVTDDASMKEVVRDRQNGILVQKANPADLAQKIMMILKNKALYESISVNARETIDNKYNIKTFVNKLEMIYQSILATQQVPSNKKIQLDASVE